MKHHHISTRLERVYYLVSLKQAWASKGVLFSMHDIGDRRRESFSTTTQWNVNNTLNFLWHKWKTLHVKLQSLPLTSAAATNHSLHVYFQWKISAKVLHPRDWEWQEYKEGFAPLQNLYTSCSWTSATGIRCNCRTNCTTLRYSCKNALPLVLTARDTNISHVNEIETSE